MARKKLVGNLAGIVHLPFSSREFLACLDASRDRKKKKGIVFRTYMSFDFIVDGEVIIFTFNKAKELSALLVANAGGTLEKKEAIARLWPGKRRILRSGFSGLR